MTDGIIETHEPAEGPLGSVLGLASDAKGRIWITTNGSVRCFDPHSKEFLAVPIARQMNFTKAINTLSKGHIAMAADNSLLVIDPAGSEELPPIPVPVISAFHAPERSLQGPPEEGWLDLSYRGSTVELWISAQYFGAISPVEFLYQLEGTGTGWNETDASRPITYSALPSGDHELLVRVRDPYGRTGETHRLLLIRVSAPFWRSWWFYALIALGISTGIYLWSRYRIDQAVRVQRVRDRIASDLHDEVGSSLSSITIGSQLAMRLGHDQNEQVRDLLTRIGKTSSESLRSMSDIVWAIDPKNDEGEALVGRMRRFANDLLDSKGIETVFIIGPGIDELKLSMHVRKELLLLYKEAIHNASKYSGSDRVCVSLCSENGRLILTVRDNGSGFDVALHQDGHGLASMRRRAADLGSDLMLTSAPGEGTEVGVSIEIAKIRE